MKISVILKEGKKLLSEAGIYEPQRESKLIVCYALNINLLRNQTALIYSHLNKQMVFAYLNGHSQTKKPQVHRFDAPVSILGQLSLVLYLQ